MVALSLNFSLRTGSNKETGAFPDSLPSPCFGAHLKSFIALALLTSNLCVSGTGNSLLTKQFPSSTLHWIGLHWVILTWLFLNKKKKKAYLRAQSNVN